MEIFKIVKDNKPSLRQRCEDVQLPLDEKTKTTLFNMLEYLRASQDDEFLERHPKVRSGVGLAAPQIGINKKMIAISFEDSDNKKYEFLLVNPKIVSESIKECYLEGGEGCLSVDDAHPGYVYRKFKITVKAYDLLKNDFVTYELKGYPAIVLQHEIDHLKGVLFYDHIDKKNPFIKKPGALSI